jgi:hypothetical protein
MEKKYDNKQWGVADFERYYSGTMPELEMHALEKAALDDPFLEDALEGYSFTKTGITDVEELKKKLGSTKEENKIIWYKRKGISQFFKLAAALVLFLGFAWLLNNNKEENKEEIAGIPATKKTRAVAIPDSAEIVSTGSRTVPAQEAYKESKKVMNEPAASLQKQKQQEFKEDEIIAQAPALAVTDSPGAGDVVAVENIHLSSRQKSSAPPSVVTQPLEGKVKGLVVRNQNAIRGRVVDDAGNPVAFANINDRENNLVLAADKDGYFSLNNRQNASNVKVDVRAIGYETNNVALSADNKENKIVLTESNQALNEVVVTGYGARKKSAVTDSPQKMEKDLYRKPNNITLVNALPVAGWNNFNRFIEDSLHNKKLPASGYKELILIFEIDSLGKATDITVKNPVSDSIGAVAKQILRSVPALKKIKKGNKAQALIRL